MFQGQILFDRLAVYKKSSSLKKSIEKYFLAFSINVSEDFNHKRYNPNSISSPTTFFLNNQGPLKISSTGVRKVMKSSILRGIEFHGSMMHKLPPGFKIREISFNVRSYSDKW